jgi:hypothetical protein
MANRELHLEGGFVLVVFSYKIKKNLDLMETAGRLILWNRLHKLQALMAYGYSLFALSGMHQYGNDIY